MYLCKRVIQEGSTNYIENLSDRTKKAKLVAASDKNTPPEKLIKLSKSKIAEVRREVACNPSLPLRKVSYLKDDEDWIVRMRFVLNCIDRIAELRSELEFFDID